MNGLPNAFCLPRCLIVHAEIAGVDHDGNRLNLVWSPVELVTELIVRFRGGSPDHRYLDRADAAPFTVVARVSWVGGGVGSVEIVLIVRRVPDHGAHLKPDNLLGNYVPGPFALLAIEHGVLGIGGVDTVDDFRVELENIAGWF